MFEANFKFLKILPTQLKALCLGVSEPIIWLAARRKAQTLHHRPGQQAYVKENEKNISVEEVCKILEINGWILFEFFSE